MVSSTDIPNAILKTKRVDGFKGMPNHPIIPPVKRRGIIFGIIDMTTILQDLNKMAIRIPIEMTAKIKLVIKFFTKYFVPSAATTDVPVKVTSKYSLSMAFRSTG